MRTSKLLDRWKLIAINEINFRQEQKQSKLYATNNCLNKYFNLSEIYTKYNEYLIKTIFESLHFSLTVRLVASFFMFRLDFGRCLAFCFFFF